MTRKEVKIGLIIYLVLFIMLPVICQAQNEIIESETVIDSLEIAQPVKDSLEIPADSLTVIEVSADSIYIPVEEIPDTMRISLKELKQSLDQYLEDVKNNKEKLQFPFILYNENFHLKTPFDPGIRFIKNGFTVIPFKISNLHILQNYNPFFNTEYKRGFTIFTESDYDLPVAVSESFLCLGEGDMNYAFVSFTKGKILGLKNINLKIDYLGQEGQWLSVNEKSHNFNLHLFSSYNWGKLHLYHTTIDQKISTNKLVNAPELPVSKRIKDKLSDTAILFENKYINVGMKYERLETDTLKREISEVILSKKLEWGTHHINGNYEYFMNNTDDTDFHLLTLDHHSQIAFLDLGNSGYYQDDENHFFASELEYTVLQGINVVVDYSIFKSENIFFFQPEERTGTGLVFDLAFLKIKAIAGKENLNEENTYFAETTSYADLHYNRLQLKMKNWTLFRDIELEELPIWQCQTSLEFILNLEYNNAIKLGIEHVYTSEYSYTCDNRDKFSNLDAWLAFQVTKRFEIKIDAVNLLNIDRLFAYPVSEQLSGPRFNVNLHWIFIN
ncbi:MAG: hypothetical protein H8E11_00815 [Candidatus Cloacimonetes bacterium]|nr:hypothetical protein [Candidatus Cloacimonadota bacterium]